VNELAASLQFLVTGNLFFQEVLDRLHVVIRSGFDILDALCIGFVEILNDVVQELVCCIGESRYLGDLFVLA